MMSLLGASTHAELHRALVLRPPAMVERETLMAVSMLKRAHNGGADGVADTVVLMATDPRWKSVSRELMVAVEGLGIVPDDVFDVIADAFVAADEFVFWECPVDWFGGEEIMIELGDRNDADTDLDDADLDGDDLPAVAQRAVPGGTRRWAVARVVRADPGRWGSIVKRSAVVGAKHRSAMMMGLLDAAEVLPEPAARHVEQRALEAGDVAVRLASLRRIADRDPEAACVRAMSDPNQRIRDWAPHVRAGDGGADVESTDAVAGRRRGGHQDSLF